MNVQAPFITLAIGLFVSLMGTIVGLAVYAARRETTFRADIAQLRADQVRENGQFRKDLIGIGEKVRQSESKIWYLAWSMCPEKDRKEVLNALVRRLS